MSALLDEVRESLALPAPPIARQIRESAGVSQARLAEEMGVSAVTVYRWETGRRTPQRSLRVSYVRLLRQLEEATRCATGNAA